MLDETPADEDLVPVAFRCEKHVEIPPFNRSAWSSHECGACVSESTRDYFRNAGTLWIGGCFWPVVIMLIAAAFSFGYYLATDRLSWGDWLLAVSAVVIVVATVLAYRGYRRSLS